MKQSTCFLVSALFLCLPANAGALVQDNQTFAIQNIGSGKNLRPFGAGRQDGNRVILYDHHSWKCLTWTFLQAGEGRYRLTNYYTGKALDVSSVPKDGVPLVQHEKVPDSLTWDFVALPGDAYAIRLTGTELYITAASTETNTPITLSPFIDMDSQKWQLIPQKPWF